MIKALKAEYELKTVFGLFIFAYHFFDAPLVFFLNL